MKNPKFLNVMSTVLLAAVLLLGIFALPTTAYATTDSDYSYTVENGVATITDYYGSGGDITIPSTLGGYPVTIIGEEAFEGCRSLTGVTIPDSVIRIDSFAFEGCWELTRLTIGNSVTSIGFAAFWDCTALTSVIIPDSIESIGDVAFPSRINQPYAVYDNAKYLGNANNPYVALISETSDDITSCTIHPDTKVICDGAFWNCKALTSVTIPDSVTSIGFAAFSGCEALTSITIPNSVTSIGSSAFSSCDSLTSVTIPDSVQSIGYSAFEYCTSLTSVTIPDSVTSIGNYAFYDCSRLTSVTIGNSVESIGYQAFYNCYRLTSVYYGGSQSQWDAIRIDDGNYYLTSATIYYNHTHDYTLLPATTVAPTCTEDGYTEYTCLYGETYREVLLALGHTTGADGVVTPATCTEEGYTTSTCPRCGITVTTDYVAALGHDYSGPVVTVDPTCTEQGYTGNTCTRCGDVEKTNLVDALGHKMVVFPASEPTCEKPGLTAGSGCERCGIVGVAQKETAPALGHSMVSHSAKAPSCTEVGWEAYEACEKCDHTTYREIPMLDHAFADGVCTVCGKLDRVPGDIDGNDVVDRNDVIQLLLHVTMPGRFPIDCDADFNGDGAVNRDDVIKLLLHVTMPNRFPLEVRKKD